VATVTGKADRMLRGREPRFSLNCARCAGPANAADLERNTIAAFECQSVSLTRDIPEGLGRMIGPFVTSIPRESRTYTLATIRGAVLQRITSHTTRWKNASVLTAQTNSHRLPHVSIFFDYLNVAVAVLSRIMVNVQVPDVVVPIATLQVASLAVVAVPPHAVNVDAGVDPGAAVAVRVTNVPLTYRAVQVPDSVRGVVVVAAVCVQSI
jgi:hypothetical protein